MAPLHRGFVGVRVSDVGRNGSDDDSQMKDRNDDKEEVGARTARSFPAADAPFRFLAKMVLPVCSKPSPAENGYGSESPSAATARTRLNFTLFLLKLSLLLLVLLAFSWSVWWTISISNSSRGNVYKGYRRLQEQLITDLADIGVLSLGLAKLKEVDFCSPEFENYVPCFNVSDASDLDVVESVEYERVCTRGSSLGCLVLPPKNYRIPLRWPTGKDVIWIANVKITAQEVLSSGSWTKR